MREQFVDLTRRLRRQVRESVLQVGIRIMSIEPRRLDQAHDRRCPFPLRNEPANSQFERPIAHGRI